MTTDNAKPAVITAAEFVAKRYAERIAAGECKVFALTYEVSSIETYPNAFLINYVPFNEDDFDPYYYADVDHAPMLNVEWLPVAASSTDADEVARLRADVARLREVMNRILRDDELNADRYKSWIIAALETEEAGE